LSSPPHRLQQQVAGDGFAGGVGAAQEAPHLFVRQAPGCGLYLPQDLDETRASQ
jgi:hypothetical protein